MNKLWKKLSIGMSIFYLISLIPVFLVGQYMYPLADDYSFGSKIKSIWDSGHSLIETTAGAVNAAVYYYENWAGCFTSSFFMVMQPAVFGTVFYRFTPMLMIGMLSLSTLFFLKVLLSKVLELQGWLAQGMAMIYLFVVVQCVISPLEAYFWYNGAVHYTLLHSLCLFLYGVILWIAKEKEQGKKKALLAVSGVLAFLVGGGNYLTALNAAIIFVTSIIFLVYRKKIGETLWIFLPAGLFFLAFLTNIMAPGNTVRAGVSHGFSPLKAILLSFYYVYQYCLGEWTGWMVLLGGGMIAILFWYGVDRTGFTFPYPLVVIGYGFCLTAAMITPSLYGTGNVEAGRIKSLIFTMYVLVLYFSIAYVTGWLKKRCTDRGDISSNTLWTLGSCLIFLGFGYAITAVSEPEKFTSSEAVWELVSGEARIYARQMNRREVLCRSGEEEVVLPKVTVHPDLLFLEDISEDSTQWQNQAMSRFFSVKSIRVEKE